nr:MAG TPA: hypothetical protein [Herelleviridae sp.]
MVDKKLLTTENINKLRQDYEEDVLKKFLNTPRSKLSYKEWKLMNYDNPRRFIEDHYDKIENIVITITCIIGFTSFIGALVFAGGMDLMLPASICAIIGFIVWCIGACIDVLLIPSLKQNAFDNINKLYRYQNLNKSYFIKLNGDSKPRYYAGWYLKLKNIDAYNNNINLNRPDDKNHWKNTLYTNRPITLREFKQLERQKDNFNNKLKEIDKMLELDRDIKEFQEYHGFTSKKEEE